MGRTGLLLGVCFLLLASMSAAPIPKKLRQKALPLDGRWALVDMNYDNRHIAVVLNQIWNITSETMVMENITGAARNNDAKYSLNPVTGDGDNAVDWVIDYNNANRNQKSTYKGRYTIDGDQFVFSFSLNNIPRPENTQPGPQKYVYTFQRKE